MKIALKVFIISIFNISIYIYISLERMMLQKSWLHNDAKTVTLCTVVPKMNQQEKFFNLY